jgi:hypothetical protein
MSERYCALSIGILFAVVGVAGFVPSLVSLPGASAPDMVDPSTTNMLAAGYTYVFGLFPTNLLHNIVHIIVGSLGVVSFTSLGGARLFNRGFAIAYALIALMGLLPFANTTFGLMPIFGNNVWFNALTAAVAGYYGFVTSAQATDVGVSSQV